jgi:hypothetical protein
MPRTYGTLLPAVLFHHGLKPVATILAEPTVLFAFCLISGKIALPQYKPGNGFDRRQMKLIIAAKKPSARRIL